MSNLPEARSPLLIPGQHDSTPIPGASLTSGTALTSSESPQDSSGPRSPPNDPGGRPFLEGLLDKPLAITASDDRLFIGLLKCVDWKANVILFQTEEFIPPAKDWKEVEKRRWEEDWMPKSARFDDDLDWAWWANKESWERIIDDPEGFDAGPSQIRKSEIGERGQWRMGGEGEEIAQEEESDGSYNSSTNYERVVPDADMDAQHETTTQHLSALDLSSSPTVRHTVHVPESHTPSGSNAKAGPSTSTKPLPASGPEHSIPSSESDGYDPYDAIADPEHLYGPRPTHLPYPPIPNRQPTPKEPRPAYTSYYHNPFGRGDGRNLGMVTIPGQHIVKVEKVLGWETPNQAWGQEKGYDEVDTPRLKDLVL